MFAIDGSRNSDTPRSFSGSMAVTPDGTRRSNPRLEYFRIYENFQSVVMQRGDYWGICPG